MNIREEIKQKFNIDIAKENLLKLYKIDDINISCKDIYSRVKEARIRWNQSVNGSNEKNAERDKKRLEKADKYEKIILNETYLLELFQYYASNSGDEDYQKALKKAEVYFSNLSMGKSISQVDVDFYFDFYKNDKKYKKTIIDILNEKYNITNEQDSEVPDRVGQFSKDTILGIQKCIELLGTIQNNKVILDKYPEYKHNLYDAIGVNNICSLLGFKAFIIEQREKFYNERQERGDAYIGLVDLFNNLNNLVKQEEVIANYECFKLLIQYPALTPYMYSLKEIGYNFFYQLYTIGCSEYTFIDKDEFFQKYFEPICEGFGIANRVVLNNKAEFDKPFSKIRKPKKTKRISPVRSLINDIDITTAEKAAYVILYLPFYIMMYLYKFIKLIITNMHLLAIPSALALLIVEIIYGPINIFSINKFFEPGFVKENIEPILGYNISVGVGINLYDVVAANVIFTLITILPFLLGMFIRYFSYHINSQIDWERMDNEFEAIELNRWQEAYEMYKKGQYVFRYFVQDLFKKKLIINGIAAAVIAIIVTGICHLVKF